MSLAIYLVTLIVLENLEPGRNAIVTSARDTEHTLSLSNHTTLVPYARTSKASRKKNIAPAVTIENNLFCSSHIFFICPTKEIGVWSKYK